MKRVSTFEKLAGILLEKESIEGDELKQFAEEVRSSGGCCRW